MSLDVALIDSGSGEKFVCSETFRGDRALVVTGAYDLQTRVSAVSRSSAGTTIVAQPILEGGMIIRDIVVTSKKLNATNVQINWTDGTNSITIVDIDNTSGIQFHIPFTVPIPGWTNARLELVTDGNFNCNATCSYVKFPTTLSYADWIGEI
jgi:hypothetical protein